MDPVAEYIAAARGRGLADSEIRNRLEGGGWSGTALAAYFPADKTGFFAVFAETIGLIAKRFLPIFFVWLVTSLATLVSLAAVGFSAFLMFMTLAARGNPWPYFFLAVFFSIPMAFSIPWGQASLIAVTSQRLNLAVAASLRWGMRFTLKNSVLGLVMTISVVGNLFYLFVPGLIVATWVAFANYALVVDGLSVRAALSYSRKLSEGRFLPIFLILFVFVFFNTGASYLLSLLADWAALPFWLIIALQVLFNFLVASFGVVFIQVLYEKLRQGVNLPTDKPHLSWYVLTGSIGTLLLLFAPVLIGWFFGISRFG